MAPRIIGGSPASSARYPYTATIVGPGGSPQSCTGFLIAPNVVLTNPSFPCLYDTESVALNCQTTEDLSSCEVIGISERLSISGNDVALTNPAIGLLILEKDSSQTPVSLLDLNQDAYDDNYIATVLSFGDDERPVTEYYSDYGQPSEVLLEADATIVDGKTCLSQYNAPFNIDKDPYALEIPKADNFFCVEPVGEGVSICDNDRAAGAVLKCNGAEQDVLLGLFSTTIGCGNSGLPPIFSLTNSFEAMSFIRTELESRNIFIDFKDMNFCSAPLYTSNVSPTPYPNIPNFWHCEARLFASGGECNCNCGQFDPDCEFSDVIKGCLPGQACNLDGNCVFDNALEPSVPVGWICDPVHYNDGEFCDCDCGVIDPDCENQVKTRGCMPGQTCSKAGICEGVAVPVPEGWTCFESFYASFDGCDCNCGVSDPDCFVEGQEVFGCPEEAPFCFYEACVTEEVFNRRRQVPEVEEKRIEGSSSVTFDGTVIVVVLGLAVCATIVFTVYRVTRRERGDREGIVTADPDHTL